ncbi:MAG TPA: hypothetical protein VGK78_03050 [Nocardioides sp.]|uniref:hypothetical protein n=1 Tax=Nocardioides sp. TaxID=35761 RepID=UPI002F413CC0
MNADHTEDLLTQTLHEHTERTDYPTTPLLTVAARARAVRARRRRTTVLAAAATIAAVAVPGAVWLGRSPDASTEPTVAPSTTTSSATVSTSPSTALADLPVGHKPGIDYLDGDTYIDMNGGRLQDPALTTATVATPVRGGLLFALPGKTPDLAELWVHGQNGDQQLGCGRGHFAMSADGVQSAYWVKDSCSDKDAGRLYDGADNTMGEGGPGFVRTPLGDLIDPVGIQPGKVVVNAWRGQTPTAELIDSYTGEATPLSALRVVTGSDENNQVVSGELAGQPADQVGESAVVDVRTGTVKWRADWQLGQFSTDGKYVVGLRSGDGSADSYAVFNAATGAKVADLGGWTPGWITQVAWDFDDTLLAVADDGQGQTAIVRFDLNGHVTRTTAVRQQKNASLEVYRLATRP